MLGVVLMLLLWPKNLPTATALFWTTVIGIPAIASAVVVVIPLLLRAGAQRDADAWNRARDVDVQKAFQSESRAIALLAGSYRFSLDDEKNDISNLVSGDLLLVAQPTPDRSAAVEARWFDAPACAVIERATTYDATRQLKALDNVLKRLLDAVTSAIQTLPGRIPLTVKLHVVAPLITDDIEKRFQLAWKFADLRDVAVIHEPVPPGLMSLDRWLDQGPGPERDHATLLVVIQLHRLVSKSPPKGCAEAGVALLTIPEDLARRNELQSKARIFRPREGTIATLAETLKFALTWGAAESDKVGHLWHTGFDMVGQRALLSATKSVGLPSTTERQPPGAHNLERMVGHAGAAADWLALACACEYADAFGGPQLVATHDGRHASISVVRPTDRPTLHKSL